MKFIRDICKTLINLFISRPRVSRSIIDETKTLSENFESLQTDDPSDEEIEKLPREMIAEPFYSTMFSDDLVESPLYLPGHMPMAGVLLAPPQLVYKATHTDKQHLDEDTVV